MPALANSSDGSRRRRGAAQGPTAAGYAPRETHSSTGRGSVYAPELGCSYLPERRPPRGLRRDTLRAEMARERLPPLAKHRLTDIEVILPALGHRLQHHVRMGNSHGSPPDHFAKRRRE
jgi:hypothetical protein